MEKRLKLLLFSFLVLIFVVILAIVTNKPNTPSTDIAGIPSPTPEPAETEAREVVYLIFPTSQNTTELHITEVVKEPDSSNLLAAGFESDYKDTSDIPDSSENDTNENVSPESPESTKEPAKPDPTINNDNEDENDNDADNSSDENENSDDENSDDEDSDDEQPEASDNPDEQTETPSPSDAPIPEETENPDLPIDNPTDNPTDNPADTPEVAPEPPQDQLAEAPDAGSPIAAMYLKYAASSSGNLDYIVYVPANANANTPIFMFLHGNGEVGKDMEKAVTRYAFLQRLKDGSWQPGCIIICPIAKRKSYWTAEVNNLNIIIDEVTSNYGGSRNLMYISGASAGADAMTRIAAQIPFKGAIYMAGHLNSGGYSVSSFLSLWQGKPVYYYRDNLAGGGYGFSRPFVESCIANAPLYGVRFSWTDLNWNHSIGLVDATFLPSNFIDANGRPCQNGLEKLIYGQ